MSDADTKRDTTYKTKHKKIVLLKRIDVEAITLC